MSEIAIYQVGYAFFGVGKTLDEAIVDSHTWTDEKLTRETVGSDDAIHGAMVWVRVSDALAKNIRDNGQCAHERVASGFYVAPEET